MTSTHVTYLWLLVYFREFILNQAACPQGWETISTNCYKLINSSTPFSSVLAARGRCASEGADLATFTDFTEQSSLYATILSLSPVPNDVYIGFSKINQMNSYDWLDNSTSVGYDNFTVPYNENNTRHTADDCVSLTSQDGAWDVLTSGWRRVSCCFPRGVKTVACMKPDNANVTISSDILQDTCQAGCPADWHHISGKCYKAVAMTTTANSTYMASQACQGEGGQLASVTSEILMYKLGGVLDTADESRRPVAAYIGNHNLSSSGDFSLLDNSSFTREEAVLSSNYDPSVDSCLTLNSTSKTWQTSDLTYQPVLCCGDEMLDWAVCEREVSGPTPAQDDDDNIFARKCYGDIDDCSPDPCKNGATCVDHVLRHECVCPPGHTGVNCETEINYCSPPPCQHGGNCTSQTATETYTCTCHPAYSGSNCETVIDQCVSNPCQNGATCVDGDEHYNCTCVTGFNGATCETNIDDCVNVTCLNNGTCQDGVNMYTCDCGVAYTGAMCETEITCLPVIPDVINATHEVIGGNLAGSQIVYTCFDGMKFPDMSRNKTITCLATSSWDIPPANIGHCDRHCPPIPNIAFGSVEHPDTRIGSHVNYTCLTGYRFPDNSTTMNMTCLESGNWTLEGADLQDCEIVKCPELPVHQYQELDTFNNTYDTTITFWCDVGYELHDKTTARTIKCKENGEWTAPLPPCNPVRCPYIDPPASWSILRNTDNNTYGTYVHYECTDKKRMLDGSTFRDTKCDATGEWSDNITECTNTRCFPLPFVANATPSTLDAEFGTQTWLDCIKGHRFYEKYRRLRMTCQGSDGWWNPILSSCEPIYCDEIPTVLNTNRNTDSRLYSTVVEFTCIKGHYYYPNMTSLDAIECMDDEKWNTTDVDPCWPIVCDPPPTIENGTRTLPNNYNYSSVASYSCKSGFKFIDGMPDRDLVCTELGVWNVTDVSCRVDRCLPVPEADFVVPDTRNTSWYTNVTYTCARGYEWPNNKSTHHIQCQNDGRWNDTNIPKCTIKECVPVMEMNNATINTTTHVFDTFVRYDCDVGYKFPDNETSSTRWCSDMAKWEPQEFPACEIIYCPELEDVENATRSSNDTYYDMRVTYTCLPGYQYPDKSRVRSITCTANETWTEYPPPCEVVFCPPVPWWTETKFNSTDNEFHAVVSYSCDEGYSFQDSFENPNAVKIATCMESKVWAPEIDDCLARESIAADLVGVVTESDESVPIGTIACAVSCSVLTCIIILDTKKIYMDLKVMKSNVESFIRSRKSNRKVSDSSTCIQQDTDA